MENILCLVDFTPTSIIARDQAIALAKWKQTEINFCHIVSKESDLKNELIVKLEAYESAAAEQGVEASSITGKGNLFAEIERISRDLKPGLVVIGTHGKSGLNQSLFGSYIYRMVQKLKYPCLVVSDFTNTVHNGFKNILMPVAPHNDYMIKVKQASDLVADQGVIHIFEIRKPGAGYNEKLEANTRKAQSYFEEHGINHNYIEKGSRDVHDGFSQETLDFAVDNDMDLMAIMTQISEDNKKFGKSDKENALLNKLSLPVLSCNA